jgi:hypothetical protein
MSIGQLFTSPWALEMSPLDCCFQHISKKAKTCHKSGIVSRFSRNDFARLGLGYKYKRCTSTSWTISAVRAESQFNHTLYNGEIITAFHIALMYFKANDMTNTNYRIDH